MKLLMGRVTVQTMEMEIDTGETVPSATEIELKASDAWKDPQVLKTTYIMPWAEGGIMDTEAARSKILLAFLNLMKEQIPMTPSVKPLIITP